MVKHQRRHKEILRGHSKGQNSLRKHCSHVCSLQFPVPPICIYQNTPDSIFCIRRRTAGLKLDPARSVLFYIFFYYLIGCHGEENRRKHKDQPAGIFYQQAKLCFERLAKHCCYCWGIIYQIPLTVIRLSPCHHSIALRGKGLWKTLCLQRCHKHI